MKSFFIALLFLLTISYWSHLLVSRQTDPNELAPVTIDNTINYIGICECRCCILSGTICESTIRHQISYKNNFSCHLCTNDFCMKNMTESIQCSAMYSIKSECYQHEHRRDSSSEFINIRPILQ
jgi:hypothetical protein